MKIRMSRRKKITFAVVALSSTLGAGAAWAYLLNYGVGTATAYVQPTAPAVLGSDWEGKLRPDRLDAITVQIYNPLDQGISVTQIPVGVSSEVTDIDWQCPEGSVKAGGADFEGNIIANGDGVNAIPESGTGDLVIGPGETANYMLWAKFDTIGFPDDLQNGCLGQSLNLTFPAITYVDAP